MISKKSGRNRSGFTLIELVVVIGILAVLFAIVLIAINPSKQFKAANDTKRRSDVNAILNAVYQYSADEKGKLPFTLSVGASAAISTAGIGNAFCTNLVSDYIAAMPTDPGKPAFVDCNGTAGYDSGYVVGQAASGRVTVSATAEGPEPIVVTR
jgi:prepilin-type N-terminal cleavage/methylation domain-containing protein